MKPAAAAVVLATAAAAALVTLEGCERRPADGTSARAVPATPAAAAPTAPGPAIVPAAERHRPAASGGVAILASAGGAEAVVAGTLADVRPVDLHGWRAELAVDRVLGGAVRLGDRVTVAWEELASARQVRFTSGQRVLLVLDPLPTQSLWRKRFPAEQGGGRVLVVAARGEAFLATPDGVTTDVLGHYLAMAPDARAGAPGARRLAELVRGAHPALAREALAVLEARTASGELLGAEGAAALLAAARSPEREPALRGGALRLAARHRLPGTDETARTQTGADSPIRVDAWRALAALPAGLSGAEVERLLGDPDPSVRALAVELAPPEVARARLVAFVTTDPAPDVRLAAGRALLARHQAGAIGDVVAALDDSDAAVRTGIAEAVGALGTPAVAPLRTVVDGGSERAALAAVLGLTRAGRQGGIVIAAVADTHPNQAVRALARLALGDAPGHEH